MLLLLLLRTPTARSRMGVGQRSIFFWLHLGAEMESTISYTNNLMGLGVQSWGLSDLF
jgi:hypothetical protein